MRVLQSWLSEHVADLPSAEATGEAFVRVGFEIEEIHPAPEVTGPVKVGRVLEIEELTGLKKPIRWCQVDVGEQTPRGVICGATNFAVGDLVVVTLPGTVLPGGFEITARKTYGHVSDGMIASVRELGIGSDHAGILVLPPHTAEPGDDALAAARGERPGDRAEHHARPRLRVLRAGAGARDRDRHRRGLRRPREPGGRARRRG